MPLFTKNPALILAGAAVFLVLFYLIQETGVPQKWRPYVNLVSDVSYNDIDAVKQDLANGVDPNKMPHEDELDEAALCVAAQKGNLEIVRLLLDHGADPNIHDGWEGSPLAAAARMGNVPTMELLVSRGANVSESGDDALYNAVRNGKLNAMQFLLERHVNPSSTINTNTKDALSLLSVAKRSHQKEAVTLLRKYGAKEH
jgi:ankyrin repeat protein